MGRIELSRFMERLSLFSIVSFYFDFVHAFTIHPLKLNIYSIKSSEV